MLLSVRVFPMCCRGAGRFAEVPHRRDHPSAQVHVLPDVVRLMPADVTAAGCRWGSSSTTAQACSGPALSVRPAQVTRRSGSLEAVSARPDSEGSRHGRGDRAARRAAPHAQPPP